MPLNPVTYHKKPTLCHPDAHSQSGAGHALDLGSHRRKCNQMPPPPRENFFYPTKKHMASLHKLIMGAPEPR